MIKTIIASISLSLLLIYHSKAQNTLEDYVRKAQQNSPLIIDNLNQSQANGIEVERLKAFYTKPQLNLTANYLFAPIISADNNQTRFEPNTAGAKNYYGYDLAASNSGQYQTLLTITQPLFNGTRYKTFSNQANIAAEVNRNTAKLTAHDVEKFVTDQYILCLQDKNQTAYARNMTSILEEQKLIIQKLVESGIYKQSDLTLIQIEYQNFLGLLATYNATYRRDLMDLNVLCGINDTSLVILSDIDLKLTNTPESSGYLEKYRLDSMNLQAIRKTFELKYKPLVNVFANTGLNAVYLPTIPNRFGINAGLTLTWNLFDGGQKNLMQNKTNTLMRSVSYYKQNFIAVNEVRKTRFLSEIQSFDNRTSIARQQLSDYETLLNAYKKEVLQGQLSIINFINTLKNMSVTQRDYAILLTQRQLLINAYNYWNW